MMRLLRTKCSSLEREVAAKVPFRRVQFVSPTERSTRQESVFSSLLLCAFFLVTLPCMNFFSPPHPHHHFSYTRKRVTFREGGIRETFCHTMFSALCPPCWICDDQLNATLLRFMDLADSLRCQKSSIVIFSSRSVRN